MKIKDDGKSFEVESALNGKGSKRLGLLGMRERLEMIGGHFSVQSAPGQGTTITAQLKPDAGTLVRAKLKSTALLKKTP